MDSFKIYSKPSTIYFHMLKDIQNAKSSIYLETYQFDNDKVGRLFRKALLEKVKEGVRVRVLVDVWQSTADKEFFKDLIEAGAKVKFFREIKYVLRFISKNHERNHRKLLIIDKRISYVGSANITAMGMDWRELVVRFEGDITEKLFRTFVKTWNSHGKISKKRLNRIFHKSFKIINDAPSQIFTPTKNEYVNLINKAKNEILIITPYFVPNTEIRQAFIEAINRGVNIIIIIPEKPDVTLITYEKKGFLEKFIENNARVLEKGVQIYTYGFLGKLVEKGVNIYTYMPSMIHTKLLVIDKKFFLFGSSNLDYRSFMHLHEINVVGKDKLMIKQLREYFSDTLKDCKYFNHNRWKRRSVFKRILEMLLYYGRRYL